MSMSPVMFNQAKCFSEETNLLVDVILISEVRLASWSNLHWLVYFLAKCHNFFYFSKLPDVSESLSGWHNFEFYNLRSVYLYIFSLSLSHSITKKTIKSRQALHSIFLKPWYKVYIGASILHFNTLFSDVPSFSKISQPAGYKQHMVNSVVYHPYSS